MMKMVNEKIVVLDLGSPTNQKLTRDIRELGVYSELHPHTLSADDIRTMDPAGIIISGGPYHLHDANQFRPDPDIFGLDIPILGVCYGAQVMADALGGEVKHQGERDYVEKEIQVTGQNPLLKDMWQKMSVCCSVGDVIESIPADYKVDAQTVDGEITAFSHVTRKQYGIQFYLERGETSDGIDILRHFLFDISGCNGDWSVESFIESEIASIRKKVGNRKVLCALSGGVDSSVVAAIIHKAIGDQLTCIFVDHGLLRKNEVAEVMASLADDFHMNIKQIDASDRFLNKLSGVDDPEQKRKIIGNEFIEVFNEEARQLTDVDFLAQGTLYSDVIESGSALGKSVKSHHNVGGLPDDLQFILLEPIRELFKDEVRKVGTALGMPDSIIWRQPFPGPGLGIRVLGEVTRDKLHIVREADAILREEIKNAGLDRSIWQYFAVLPSIRSVGVKDGSRSYDHTIGLRAVHSVDGMTSDWARIDWGVLERISGRIMSEVEHVNRVVYDITPKPPA
ncbi:MAG TPA: glutamine-hydrolyzing GMP synthase, partial [Bacillota bacterium]|nr:glutamine-hydrolyzing GMP synthase [Bacillota bacterium]